MPHVIEMVNTLFGLLAWGTGAPARYLFMVFVSALSAWVALALFRTLSDQARLALLRKRIQGNILQISLYPDRPGILVKSLGAVLADTGRSLKESLIPLAAMALPMALVMVEVNNFCGSAPFAAGTEFTVRARTSPAAGTAAGTADGADNLAGITLEPSPGIEILAGPLRIPEEHLIFWRAKAAPLGGETARFVRVRVNGTEVTKLVAVESSPRRFGPRTISWSIPEGFFANAEGFLPAGAPVTLIEAGYPRAGYRLFFWNVDALVWYVMVTLGAAMIMRPFMRVHL